MPYHFEIFGTVAVEEVPSDEARYPGEMRYKYVYTKPTTSEILNEAILMLRNRSNPNDNNLYAASVVNIETANCNLIHDQERGLIQWRATQCLMWYNGVPMIFGDLSGTYIYKDVECNRLVFNPVDVF